MNERNQDQCLIITGESGSGKTGKCVWRAIPIRSHAHMHASWRAAIYLPLRIPVFVFCYCMLLFDEWEYCDSYSPALVSNVRGPKSKVETIVSHCNFSVGETSMQGLFSPRCWEA